MFLDNLAANRCWMRRPEITDSGPKRSRKLVSQILRTSRAE